MRTRTFIVAFSTLFCLSILYVALYLFVKRNNEPVYERPPTTEKIVEAVIYTGVVSLNSVPVGAMASWPVMKLPMYSAQETIPATHQLTCGLYLTSATDSTTFTLARTLNRSANNGPMSLSVPPATLIVIGFEDELPEKPFLRLAEELLAQKAGKVVVMDEEGAKKAIADGKQFVRAKPGCSTYAPGDNTVDCGDNGCSSLPISPDEPPPTGVSFCERIWEPVHAGSSQSDQ